MSLAKCDGGHTEEVFSCSGRPEPMEESGGHGLNNKRRKQVSEGVCVTCRDPPLLHNGTTHTHNVNTNRVRDHGGR
jgi:hypothetical protein